MNIRQTTNSSTSLKPYTYPRICSGFCDNEKIMRQMLNTSSLKKSGWEGYEEGKGIAIGSNMLEYVKNSGYFNADCLDKFQNAYEIFNNTKQFYEDEAAINSIIKILKALSANITRKELKIPLLQNRWDEHLKQSSPDVCSKVSDYIQTAISQFDSKFSSLVNKCAERVHSSQIRVKENDGNIEIEMLPTEKMTNILVKNFVAAEEALVNAFQDALREAQRESKGDLEQRFIIPFGFSCSDACYAIRGHQTFAYASKANDGLWCIQEINFGAAMPKPALASNYYALTTFGRCLLLKEADLRAFVADVHFARPPKAQLDEASVCYCAVWDKYNQARARDPHPSDTPWDLTSYKSAQRSGDCVMRSVEGLEEVILLDLFSNDENNKIDENDKNALKNKKRSNTIMLKCYEAVSRMGILEEYVNIPQIYHLPDSSAQLKLAVDQLGRRIFTLAKKVKKYGEQIKTPYLVENFFDKLSNDASCLCEKINTYLQSDACKKVLHAQANHENDQSYEKFSKTRYDIGNNAQSMQLLADTYAKSVNSEKNIYEFHETALTDFTRVIEGDFNYIAIQLESLITEARKNEKYNKFIVRKMMELIQNIPFDSGNIKSLSIESSSKLMKQMRLCLAIINMNCNAYTRFFNKPQKNELKNLDWQLYDSETNPTEYNLTMAVNAYAVASIVMFRIASENKYAFSGKGLIVLKDETFNFSHYMAYYSSFSCHIHSPKDAEIVRKIITYFEGEKNKDIAFDFITATTLIHFEDPLKKTSTIRAITELVSNNNSISKAMFDAVRSEQKPPFDNCLLLSFICSNFDFREEEKRTLQPHTIEEDDKDELYRKAHLNSRIYEDTFQRSGIQEQNCDFRQWLDKCNDPNITLLLSLFDILGGGIFTHGIFGKCSAGTRFELIPNISLPESMQSQESDDVAKFLNCNGENEIRCLASTNSTRMHWSNVIPLACIDCLNEDTKTVNLLHRLQKNLHILGAFDNSDEKFQKMQNPSAHAFGERSNRYALHFFEQMLQNFAREKGTQFFQSNLTQIRPIEKNARDNYEELIDAVNELEHEGMRQFHDCVADDQICISALTMVMHYKSIVLRNIIAQQREQKPAYEKILKVLTRQMRIIQDLKKNTIRMRDSDSNIMHYISIMENECILNMLELNSIEKLNDDVLKEGQKPVDVKYIEKLITNIYTLNKFNKINLPKGCLYAVNDAHEILENYWKNHPKVAKRIAIKLCKKAFLNVKNVKLLSPNGAVFKNLPNGNIIINLFTVSICKDNDFVVPCHSIIHSHDDTRKLFGSEEFEVTRSGQSHFFHDSEFGPVEIKKVNNSELTILCDLDNDENQWLYCGREISKLSGENFSLKLIPSYFTHADFNIFINKNGAIRIYENIRPKKLLYETTKVKINGKETMALKSLREQDDNCFVAFPSNWRNSFDPDELLAHMPLCFVEHQANIGILYDSDGKVTRIFIPRLKDSNNNEIFFTPFHEKDGSVSWRWSGNKNYKLCSGVDTPLFDFYGIPMKPYENLYNPLFNFKNYLCLKNTSPNSMKSYKFLIPKIHYKRTVGLSHNYCIAYWATCTSKDFLWGSMRVGEASFSCDSLIFCEKNIVGNTPLGTLHLVRAFQIQSEYEKAMEHLQFLSMNGEIGDEEIDIFREIIMWFHLGTEKSPQSANFILRAISRMLQWDQTSPKVKTLMAEINKFDGYEFLKDLIQIYLQGNDTYSTATKMSLEEEMFLWKYLKLQLSICSNNDIIFEVIDRHLAILEYAAKLKSLEEWKKLAKLNNSVEKNNPDIYGYLRESIKPQVLIDTFAQSDFKNEQNKSVCRSAETEIIQIAKDLFQINADDGIARNIFDLPSADKSSINTYNIIESETQLDPENEFQSDLKKFQEEIDEGMLNQTKKQNDPFAKNSFFDKIKMEKLNIFIEKLENKEEELRNEIPVLARKINELINVGKFEQTFYSGTWKEMKPTDAVHRIFGFYTGGKRKSAIDAIRQCNPCFSEKNLDTLIDVIENYATAMTSMRHIHKTADALRAFSQNKNNRTWETALLLIRSLRTDQSHGVGEVGKHNQLIHRFSLILELMTQIRLRPDQIEKMHFTFRAIQGKNDGKSNAAIGALIQQLMGSGKSKALIPALVLMGLYMKKKCKDNGDSDCNFGYPIIVSHITQFAAVLKELPPIFNELNISVAYINLNFQQLKTTQGMQLLRENLHRIIKERVCIPVFTSSSLMALLALFNSFESKNNANSKEYLNESMKVLKLLNQCTGIFDEIHLTANPKEAFIIEATSNSQKEIKRIAKNEIEAATDFIFNCLPNELLSACKNNQQSQIAYEKLRGYLKEAMIKKLNLMQINFADTGKKEQFISFMVGEIDGQYDGDNTNGERDSYQIAINAIMDQLAPDQLKELLVLRAIASRFIPNCFTKIYNKDFGYDPFSGEVIPYANSQPSSSKFQNPWEIICFSCLSILSGKFSKIAITHFVGHFYTQMRHETKGNVKYYDTPSYELFARYFEQFTFNDDPIELQAIVKNDSTGKYCIRDDILEAMQQYMLTPNGQICMLALAREICANAAIWNASSYSTAPSAVIENIFHAAIGASGTTYNRSAFPMCMAQYSPQTGSLGAVCAKFVKNTANQFSHIHAISPKTMADSDDQTSESISILTAEELLQQWKMAMHRAKGADDATATIQNLRIIVDSGSFLVSQGTRSIICDIAQFINLSKLDVTHIEWYDTQSKAFAIAEVDDILKYKNGNFPIKILTDAANHRPPDVGKIFTFLDAGHSVGSDPAMKKDGHGLMIANLHNMGMDAFTQSLMRERQFLDTLGQKMDLIVRKDALEELQLIKKHENVDNSNFYDKYRQEELSLNLIKHFMSNTTKDTINQRSQAVGIQLHELIVRTIQKWLTYDIEINNCQAQDIIRENFSKFFIEKNLFELDGWKYLQCQKSTRAIIVSSFNEKLKDMESILKKMKNNFSESRFLEMQEDIKNIKLQANESAKRIPKNEKFLTALLGKDSSNIECGATIEKMQQIEMQMQIVAEQTQEQEINVEQFIDLEKLMQFGTQIDSKNVRKPTCLFENVQNYQTSFSAYDYWNDNWAKNHPSDDNSPEDLEAHFLQIAKKCNGENGKKAFNEFAKFFGHSFFKSFAYSKNFLRATTIELSVFHKSQICADDALIIWDNNFENIKCIFLSKNDLSEVKKLIESEKLTNCFLATTYGNAYAHMKCELNEKVIAFLDDVKWMSYFFNGEILKLQEFEQKSYEILHKRIKFHIHKTSIQNFLMLRSDDIKACHNQIQKSRIIRDEKVINAPLLNAYKNLGIADSNIEQMSIDEFLEKVTDENDTCPITADILAAILTCGKQVISDEKKQDILVNKINMQIENDSKNTTVASILCQFSDEEILSLFFHKNKTSLEFLKKICNFILENDASRIKKVHNPCMAALLIACSCANKIPPEQLTLSLGNLLTICENKICIDSKELREFFVHVNFAKIPIYDWINNGIFAITNDFNEIFPIYMDDENFTKERARKICKVAFLKMPIESFFKNNGNYLSRQSLIKINEIFILFSTESYAKKMRYTANPVPKIIATLHGKLSDASFSPLEAICKDYPDLFHELIKFDINKKDQAMIKALLSADWFDIATEFSGSKFQKNSSLYGAIYQNMTEDIMKKIIEKNQANNLHNLILFIENICSISAFAQDGTTITSEMMLELCNDINSTKLFQTLMHQAMKFNLINPPKSNIKFINFFISNMGRINFNTFLDILKKCEDEYFNSVEKRKYFNQEFIYNIIYEYGEVHKNRSKMLELLKKIGSEFNSHGNIDYLNFDMSMLCLACASETEINDHFIGAFLAAPNLLEDKYNDIYKDIKIENKFPPIDIKKISNGISKYDRFAEINKFSETTGKYKQCPLYFIFYSYMKLYENPTWNDIESFKFLFPCWSYLITPIAAFIGQLVDCEYINFNNNNSAIIIKILLKACISGNCTQIICRVLDKLLKTGSENYTKIINEEPDIITYVKSSRPEYIYKFLLFTEVDAQKIIQNTGIDISGFNDYIGSKVMMKSNANTIILMESVENIKYAITKTCTFLSNQNMHNAYYSAFINKILLEIKNANLSRVIDGERAKDLLNYIFANQTLANRLPIDDIKFLFEKMDAQQILKCTFYAKLNCEKDSYSDRILMRPTQIVNVDYENNFFILSLFHFFKHCKQCEQLNQDLKALRDPRMMELYILYAQSIQVAETDTNHFHKSEYDCFSTMAQQYIKSCTNGTEFTSTSKIYNGDLNIDIMDSWISKITRNNTKINAFLANTFLDIFLQNWKAMKEKDEIFEKISMALLSQSSFADRFAIALENEASFKSLVQLINELMEQYGNSKNNIAKIFQNTLDALVELIIQRCISNGSTATSVGNADEVEANFKLNNSNLAIVLANFPYIIDEIVKNTKYVSMVKYLLLNSDLFSIAESKDRILSAYIQCAPIEFYPYIEKISNTDLFTMLMKYKDHPHSAIKFLAKICEVGGPNVSEKLAEIIGGIDYNFAEKLLNEFTGEEIYANEKHIPLFQAIIMQIKKLCGDSVGDISMKTLPDQFAINMLNVIFETVKNITDLFENSEINSSQQFKQKKELCTLLFSNAINNDLCWTKYGSALKNSCFIKYLMLKGKQSTNLLENIFKHLTIQDITNGDSQELLTKYLLVRNKKSENCCLDEFASFDFSQIGAISITTIEARAIIPWITRQKAINENLLNILFNCILAEIPFESVENNCTDATLQLMQYDTFREKFTRHFMENLDKQTSNLSSLKQLKYADTLLTLMYEKNVHQTYANDIIESMQKMLKGQNYSGAKMMLPNAKNITKKLLEIDNEFRKYLFFSDWFNPFNAEEYGIGNDYFMDDDNKNLFIRESTKKLSLVLQKNDNENSLLCTKFLLIIYKERSDDFSAIISPTFAKNFLQTFFKENPQNISESLSDVIIAQIKIVGLEKASELFRLNYSESSNEAFARKSEIHRKIHKCIFPEKHTEKLDQISNATVKRIEDTYASNDGKLIQSQTQNDEANNLQRGDSVINDTISEQIRIGHAHEISNTPIHNDIIGDTSSIAMHNCTINAPIRNDTSNGMFSASIHSDITNDMISEPTHNDAADDTSSVPIHSDKTSDVAQTQIATRRSTKATPSEENRQSNEITNEIDKVQKAEIKLNEPTSSITPMKEVKQNKCLVIVFGIATAITILAAIFLLACPVSGGFLAIITSLVGKAGAKVLIFAPSAIFAIFTTIFYVKQNTNLSDLK
ncbi:MAG: hypothetical protein LBI69_02565 [Puniceicoccales bacterium]|jgi:hypothetical protein|nr:hypothetical protein [Puniceicoccales bacterium]